MSFCIVHNMECSMSKGIFLITGGGAKSYVGREAKTAELGGNGLPTKQLASRNLQRLIV
jgi:hypothetical protein